MTITPTLRVVEGHARWYKRTWKGSVITTFLNPLLFLSAMGAGLGSLVDRQAGTADLGSIPYLVFLAPGLLAATAMQTGAGDSSWPVMARIKWTKTYHTALATPIRTSDLVGGHLIWVAIRLAMTSIAFVLVMVMFGAVEPARAVLVIGPAVLTGMAFSGLVTAFAAWLENETGLSSMFRFAIIPMFLFSGTFFPIAQLPGFLHPVAYLTPLWHGVELTRATALGTSPFLPVTLHVAYLIALWVGGAALALRQFERRLVT